ncbi:MAG: DNA repair protein RecN, partial [Chitinophagales bacterium]
MQIHSQHETLSLTDSKFQTLVIDSLAGTTEKLSEYQKLYLQYKDTIRQLQEIKQAALKAETDRDYLQFQLNELHGAALDTIRQEELEVELKTLMHAEEIQRNIYSVLQYLETGEFNIIDLLHDAVYKLSALSGLSNDIAPYISRLESSKIELNDIAKDLSYLAEKIIANPQQAEEIQNVLNTLYHLQKKHNVKSAEELIEKRNLIENQLAQIANTTEKITELELAVQAFHNELVSKAEALSARRLKIIPDFEKKIKHLLGAAGMNDALLKVELTYMDGTPGFYGKDDIRFTFSANKGSILQDIKKVASGGELSRLMLCIKSLIAKNIALPTLVFDEIDAGISGETALKVGQILAQLSENHQVIAITHLPQIAAMGQHHLYVYKSSDKDTTETHIRLLQNNDRVTEIARMLSGDNYTDAAIAN